jgi:hypothetical protein
MQTVPFATSDTPTLPGMLLPSRTPARPAFLPAPRAQRRSLLVRLLVDLGLCVRLAFLAAEGVLAARVVLVLLGGNPAASFSSFIYSTTGPLVAPFADVFQGAQTFGGQTVDATAMLAIVVYWILARLVEATLKTISRL